MICCVVQNLHDRPAFKKMHKEENKEEMDLTEEQKQPSKSIDCQRDVTVKH